MNQRYLFIAVLIVCITFKTRVIAQSTYPLPQPGFSQSQVYYQDWTQSFAPINYSYVYLGDTNVGANTFAKYNLNLTWGTVVRYSYYDNGRVYWHQSNAQLNNPQAGSLIYDFSLVPGDTFYYPMFSFVYYGAYVVDSVSTMTMANSQIRKYMRLTDGTHVMHWVDGIGDIVNGLTYMTDFEGGNEKLICSKDSTGDVYSVPNSPFYCSTTNPIPTSGPNNCDQFSFTSQIYGTSCIGCDGAIVISNVTGGTPGYTYSWSNGATTPSVYNLCQGPITLTIHDATGDSCSRTFVVGEYTINMNLTHATGQCSYSDTFCVSPVGGPAPYFYSWSTGSNGPCEVITSNGTYTITVYDANGCSVSQVITINNPAPLAVTTAQTSPTCSNCCDGNVTLNITGGIPPYAISGFPTWPAANNFCGGWYQYCVTDSLDCMYCDSVFVQAPLSIEEQEANFRMFPNPADDRVIVQTSSVGEVIYITDVSGKIIREKKIRSISTEMNTGDLPNGIYFVTIADHTEKLVVLRN